VSDDYRTVVQGRDAKRLLGAIRHQRGVVGEKDRSVRDANRELKRRRQERERAVQRLLTLTEPAQESETPLLDMMDGDGWRNVPLAHAVNAKAAAKLEDEHGLVTIGDLVDWQNDGHDLADVKGWGADRASVVADELLSFWTDHPEFTQPSPSDPREPGADAEDASGDAAA